MKKAYSFFAIIILLAFIPNACALGFTKQTPFQTDYEAIDSAAQSVFLLEVYDANDQLLATGSGFVAFDQGTMITNEHVIEDGAYIIAYSDQYRASYRLNALKAVDKDKDIAILSFDETARVTPLSIDTTSRLLRGQPVTAIGSPQGVINTVSSGNISNIVFYSNEIPDYIQFTAPISPGSSGGALFSENGSVIGLCVSYHKEGEAMYYAIPMKYVKEMYLGTNARETISLAQYNDISSHLSAPILLEPQLTDESIELTWTSVRNAEFYDVYRRAHNENDFSVIASTRMNDYSDRTVSIGTTYEYYIKAKHSWYTTEASNIVSFSIKTATPTPAPTATPVPQGTALYKVGDTADEIVNIKILLFELGYFDETNSFNNLYTSALAIAVRTFQQNNHIDSSGQVDEYTYFLMHQSVANENTGNRSNVYRSISSYSKTQYKLNNSGNEILKLKKLMQKLGYYRPDSDFDNTFNSTMVERVKQFQTNNSLKATGVIDYVTLIKLHASNAVKGQWYVAPTPTPAPEQLVALVIPASSYGEWNFVSGNQLKFRIQVENTSTYKTVVAYELYFYPVDVWGNRLIPEDKIYGLTVETNLKPGKKHYCDYITMADANKIDKVYVAINKVKYSNGTFATVNQHEYICWNID